MNLYVEYEIDRTFRDIKLTHIELQEPDIIFDKYFNGMPSLISEDGIASNRIPTKENHMEDLKKYNHTHRFFMKTSSKYIVYRHISDIHKWIQEFNSNVDKSDVDLNSYKNFMSDIRTFLRDEKLKGVLQ